jgi:hypothetical protein
MAEFIINQEVKTETPTVEVTLSATNALPLGRHTFRLVVVDDSGNTSIPDDVIVIVADTENPTAVLACATQREPRDQLQPRWQPIFRRRRWSCGDLFVDLHGSALSRQAEPMR